MVMPSPDWGSVTLKWAGTYLDGSPATGSLTVTYNGGVQLDDDPVMPVNIYPAKLTVQIEPRTLTTIDGKTMQVGYAEVQVPASNDPDIQGSGGTYSLTESLYKGAGRTDVPFVADLNAPGGVIWLNRIIPTTPVPGESLSVVYYSDFNDLKARVDNLAAAVGPIAAADITDATPVGRNVLKATDAAAARTAIGAGTSSLTIGTTATTAMAGNKTFTSATITDFTEATQDVIGAAIVAGSGITKTYDDTAGTVTLTATPGVAAITTENIPAGSMLAVRKTGTTWPARPTARTDVIVNWIGADPSPAIVPSGTAGMLDNIDIRFVTP